MLKKYVKILAISFIVGMAPFIPNVECLPAVEKDTIVHVDKTDDDEKDCSMITQKVDKETQITTASGCTFMVEKGWFVTAHDGMMVLEDPDRQLSITLLENKEMSAESAVLAAWKKIKPDFAHTIEHTYKGIPQDGWDEIVQTIYDTTRQEDRFVVATARRVGQTWYLELADGIKVAFERRGAGAALISSSFKVPGAQEESFDATKAHALTAAELQEFMNFVEEARILCKIPGAALAIVQDGKMILEQGFGVRTLGKPEKVTPETLFMIGSTTKSLTTFMMACLIDKGVFSWDTLVTHLMPDFALADKKITEQLTMQHMVSASTGMPRQDVELLLNYDRATPAMRIKEMRTMKPTTGFGETFQYNNSIVGAGGYIAAHAVHKDFELGAAYDAVMQSHVFNPLGMKSTTFDFNKVAKANHASPHGQGIDGTYLPLDVLQEIWVESIRPSGGAWSDVSDIAQYMITELKNGVNAEGVRVVSEKNLLKRRESQVKITEKLKYGLGLMIEDDHKVLSVGHGGNTAGFSSMMFFLPEHNSGLVLLTNAQAAGLFTESVKRKFMEILFLGNAQAQEMVKVGIDQQQKMFTTKCEAINFKPDKMWLKQFVGTYVHPTLGSIAIREVLGGAELDARVWKSALGQKKEKDGTFKLITTNGLFAGYFELVPQQQGNTWQLLLKMGQHTYVFEKQ